MERFRPATASQRPANGDAWLQRWRATFDTAGFNLGLLIPFPICGGVLLRPAAWPLILAASTCFFERHDHRGRNLKVTNNLRSVRGRRAGRRHVGPGARAQSTSIGIQFVGYGSAITGSAGVVPMSNWNNLSGWSFTNTALDRQQRRQHHGRADRQRRRPNAGVGEQQSSSQRLHLHRPTTPTHCARSAVFPTPLRPYAYMADLNLGNSEK